MSYGMAAALQAVVYQRLAAVLAVPVLDAQPAGPLAETHVLIGPEEVVDRSDKTGPGAEHRFTVSVISTAEGFLAAKAVAGEVSDALTDAGLVLAHGRLAGLWFVKAVARRLEAGAVRRIDLTFRARVEG